MSDEEFEFNALEDSGLYIEADALIERKEFIEQELPNFTEGSVEHYLYTEELKLIFQFLESMRDEVKKILN